jgi:hypothetical protein
MVTTSKQKNSLAICLESGPTWIFTVVAATAAFSTYFCMYAFRKPFAAAEFEGLSFLGTQVRLKTAFVISQIIGYTLSKYIGIKVCSEVTRQRRAVLLVGLALTAEAALVLFALLPPNLKAVAMFGNGLPLGMVWGMVVSYLEGRRTSELLLAALSCSFIVSSGAVKDVGRWLLTAQRVSEAWMPAVTGLLFLPLFLGSVWLLQRLPPPNEQDVAARVRRTPMDRRDRLAFLRQFLPGLVLLILIYFFLTAYRDFRDNYGIEIFRELGFGKTPAIFTLTELPVAVVVMGAMAAVNLIRDNRRGLITIFGIMAGGLLLTGGGTLLLDVGVIDGAWWMILVGLGSYLTYVPYNSVLFDRLIAATRVTGTAVFAIYLADAIGYTGSIGIQLYKDLLDPKATRLDYFRNYTYFLSVLGPTLLIFSGVYFLWKNRPQVGPDKKELP